MRILIFLLICNVSFCQQAFVSSGDENVTVGQVFYNSYYNDNFSVTEGVRVFTQNEITLNNNDLFYTHSFTVYPNPVQDVITVTPKFDNYRIVNPYGSLIDQGSTNINVSNFPQGAYILILEKDTYYSTFKFLKQ